MRGEAREGEMKGYDPVEPIVDELQGTIKIFDPKERPDA
jgi:hypothetical protein